MGVTRDGFLDGTRLDGPRSCLGPAVLLLQSQRTERESVQGLK